MPKKINAPSRVAASFDLLKINQDWLPSEYGQISFRYLIDEINCPSSALIFAVKQDGEKLCATLTGKMSNNDA